MCGIIGAYFHMRVCASNCATLLYISISALERNMAREKEFGIGVDVGATKVLGALVDRDDGSVVFTAKVASPQTGAADVMKAIEDAIQQVLDGAPADAKEHIRG